ncbi:MAG: hypothetical protein PHU85_00795 [Phycisphaerae bacterium]|nr:hypothetical protein [Phycisphaerae bacterium]
MRYTILTLLTAALLASPAAATIPDIPLIVQERAALPRTDNVVVGAIPLPMGAVQDVKSLALFSRDTGGLSLDAPAEQAVPAVFAVREKWLYDNSVRWATVHFTASVGADSKTSYVVRQANPARFRYPISASAVWDRATVDTGTIKFVVTRNNFNVIDQACYDPTGKGKYDKPFINAGQAKIRLNVSPGKYKVDNKVASLDVIGDAVDLTPKVDKIEVEAVDTPRAVVKVTGRFMDKITPMLDFTARIYALPDSGSVRVMFTLVNKSGKEWRDFQGINEFAIELPVRIDGDLQYTISNSAGDDAAGPIAPAEAASILLPHSDDYTLGGIAKGGGKAKSVATRRLGWADLAGKDVGVTVGIRNFWQMHPKGLTVGGDGRMLIQLVPKQDKPVLAPSAAVSQATARVDLFNGAARTHEFLIAPHAASASPRAIALGIVDPLIATARTSWYCQGTQAEGPLVDATPELFKPEHAALAANWQKRVAAALLDVAGPRRLSGGNSGLEEYGLLAYGDAADLTQRVTPNDWLANVWEGNAGDFARAAMVQFWRTGDWLAWDAASRAALHLADVEIAHMHIQEPGLAGMERPAPSRGLFRQTFGGDLFAVSGQMDSAKSQSLYDLYHMTGDAWFLDAGLLTASYAMKHTGNSLRAASNRTKILIAAYEQTGDKQYLDEAGKWLDGQILRRSPLAKWDMTGAGYGVAAEALFDLYRLTGEDRWAKAVVNCCDSLIKSFGTNAPAGATANCFGLAYQLTGSDEYLKKGVQMLNLSANERIAGPSSFAQAFRLSPYFLVYLTKDYKPPQPVVQK